MRKAIIQKINSGRGKGLNYTLLIHYGIEVRQQNVRIAIIVHFLGSLDAFSISQPQLQLLFSPLANFIANTDFCARTTTNNHLLLQVATS